MIAQFAGRSFAALLLAAPGVLTAVLLSFDGPAVERIPSMEVSYSAASAYLSPDPHTPSPTGLVGERDVDPSGGLGTDWVALRSPAQAGTESVSSKRAGRSPVGLRHWKGSNTRGRPLADLELQIGRFGVDDWVYPIDEVFIAGSPFGKRRHPITRALADHHGQDFGCRRGTPIYAAADGVVAHSKGSRTAGRYIEIDHAEHKGKMVRTRYLHLSRRLVQKGERVRMGQLIGRCGSTGMSTSPHLHFELWVVPIPRRPFRVYGQVLKSEEAEKRSWDEAIARAIEENRLRELIEAPDVPWEVRKLVRNYLRSSRKQPIDRLAPDSANVTALN